jgi:hypothetical protein
MAGQTTEEWEDVSTLAAVGRLLYPEGGDTDVNVAGCRLAIAKVCNLFYSDILILLKSMKVWPFKVSLICFLSNVAGREVLLY